MQRGRDDASTLMGTDRADRRKRPKEALTNWERKGFHGYNPLQPRNQPPDRHYCKCNYDYNFCSIDPISGQSFATPSARFNPKCSSLFPDDKDLPPPVAGMRCTYVQLYFDKPGSNFMSARTTARCCRCMSASTLLHWQCASAPLARVLAYIVHNSTAANG